MCYDDETSEVTKKLRTSQAMLLQRNISRVLCEWNKDNDVCILTAARSGHNMDNKQPKKKLLTTTKKIKTTTTC